MRPVLLEGVRRQGAEMEKRRKTVKPTNLGKLWKRRMDALSMDIEILSTSSRTEPRFCFFFQWRTPVTGAAQDQTMKTQKLQKQVPAPVWAISSNCLNWIPENRVKTHKPHSGTPRRKEEQGQKQILMLQQYVSPALRERNVELWCEHSVTLQSLPSCRNPSDSSLRKKYSLAATALEYQLLAHIAINSCNSMLKVWAEREFVKKT